MDATHLTGSTTQETSNGTNGHHPIVQRGSGREYIPNPEELAAKKERTPGRIVDIHLWWPTHDRHLVVPKRLALDGWYKDDKAKIHVPLHPGMAMNQGREVHIDAERGAQIKYSGLTGWVGVDGRYMYAADVGKDASGLQSARGKDYSKYVMWGSILIIASILGLVIALSIVAGK